MKDNTRKDSRSPERALISVRVSAEVLRVAHTAAAHEQVKFQDFVEQGLTLRIPKGFAVTTDKQKKAD